MESALGDEDRPPSTESGSAVQARDDRELIEQLKAEKIADVRRIENLEFALTTARRIGAAMGIIMAARRCTEDQAFDALSHASRKQNRKLREIADDVVLTGVVPPR